MASLNNKIPEEELFLQAGHPQATYTSLSGGACEISFAKVNFLPRKLVFLNIRSSAIR